MKPERIIGRHQGTLPGPLVICLGGVHGNEPAGVKAVELLLKMLEVEPITNPSFDFKGTLVGVAGNLEALSQSKRFIERDLNRSLGAEDIEHLRGLAKDELRAEAREVYEFTSAVVDEIHNSSSKEVYVIDLHTTTASGGIFVLASDDQRSIEIGVQMHAPVITGLARKVGGTTMDFFSNLVIPGKEIVMVVFESGQHQEELSVNRAIAGIINVLRTCGSVSSEHVENQHDYLLQEHSRGLPKVAEVLYRHHVEDNHNFTMLPGFRNFTVVRENQLLAVDNGQPVVAPMDGLILMPKYQVQGNDGFFLVRALDY